MFFFSGGASCGLMYVFVCLCVFVFLVFGGRVSCVLCIVLLVLVCFLVYVACFLKVGALFLLLWFATVVSCFVCFAWFVVFVCA